MYKKKLCDPAWISDKQDFSLVNFMNLINLQIEGLLWTI